MLKDGYDAYHQRRQEKHGRLYVVMRESSNGTIFEAKSVETGVILTLDKGSVMEQSDALRE